MAQAIIMQKIKGGESDYVKITFDNAPSPNTGNQILVYPGAKYKLGSMTDEATSDSMQMITTTAPITGYIKIKDTSISS